MYGTRLVVLTSLACMLACENPAPARYGSAGSSGHAPATSAASGGTGTSNMSSSATPAAADGGGAAQVEVAGAGGESSASSQHEPASATPAAGSGGTTSAASGGAGTSGKDAATSGRGASAATSGSESPASASDGGDTAPGPRAPARTAPGFTNLAPKLGEPLDGKGVALTPPAPDGWIWYPIDGAVCRDGSPTGFYVHGGSADKLLIYLEGGGMCSNASFCSFNPASVNQVLSGDAQTVLGTVFGAISGRQQPGVYTQSDHMGPPRGIFDFQDARNPVRDWSQIYIPYCTGDVHFGSRKNGSVPGLSNQQFVGYLNMRLFMSRIVPTFQGKLSQVLLTGANAGGFGAALNLSMVQDAFGDTPVDVLSDSGPPMDDRYMPVCMQKRWRDAWGFDDSLPPDCEGCRQSDGGGLLKLADYLIVKHPSVHIGMISSVEDEVIRLAYSVGANNCANSDNADPIVLTVSQLIDPTILMPAAQFTEGLVALRDQYGSSKRLATFYKRGANPNYDQHIFRPDFYETVNGTTLAQFMADFTGGGVTQVGP